MMPLNAKNVAYVDQDTPSKPPVLHLGDITPAVMHEFEDACIGYFENKDIEDDKKVKKILAGLKDTRIKDWVSTDRVRLLTLSFEDFMTEFRRAYLDEDWEETVCWELGAMTQGGDSFWDYAIHVQARNSLLVSTPSHLDNEKMRHRIESGMDELLACRCMHAKVNKTVDFKGWLGEVKRIDDLMRAERKEFELIAKAGRDSRRGTPFGEPSQCVNQAVASTSTSRRTPRTGKTLPKLTDGERQLLFDNDSCLKCRHFFANHHSSNCPNNFLSGTNYRTLTQADVDRAKAPHSNRKAAVAIVPTIEEGDSLNSDRTTPMMHPVTAVMATSHPIAYMPPNDSSVIEAGSGSETSDEVSTISPEHEPRACPQEADIAPIRGRHLSWKCVLADARLEFPAETDAMIDDGCHLVLIREDLASSLAVRRQN
jgi:hypothetical protein